MKKHLFIFLATFLSLSCYATEVTSLFINNPRYNGQTEHFDSNPENYDIISFKGIANLNIDGKQITNKEIKVSVNIIESKPDFNGNKVNKLKIKSIFLDNKEIKTDLVGFLITNKKDNNISSITLNLPYK